MNKALFSLTLFALGAPIWFESLSPEQQASVTAPDVQIALPEIIYRGIRASPEQADEIKLIVGWKGSEIVGWKLHELLTREETPDGSFIPVKVPRDEAFWLEMGQIIDDTALYEGEPE